MADALRKWIIADLESILESNGSFDWKASTRRVQIVAFLSFSTNDDPTAHWSATISDKHCSMEAIFTQKCIEKFLSLQVKPTSHRGAVLNIMKWKFQASTGEGLFNLLIDDMTVMGSQVFGDPKPINDLISSKLNISLTNQSDLNQEDAPENMELLIEELERKEWDGLKLSYRDYFPSAEQRALLEGLFPVTRHLPHQLQLSLKPCHEQTEEDTLVSDNESNLGFEMLLNSDSSDMDQKNIKNIGDLSGLNVTPQRSLQKQLDASPIGTDSILSEMDRGDIASQVSDPSNHNQSFIQFIRNEQEFNTQAGPSRSSDDDSVLAYQSNYSAEDNDANATLLHLPMMTQQMEQLSSLLNDETPNSENYFSDNPNMDAHSQHSQMRRFALTQAAEYLSSQNAIDDSNSQSFDIECSPFLFSDFGLNHEAYNSSNNDPNLKEENNLKKVGEYENWISNDKLFEEGLDSHAETSSFESFFLDNKEDDAISVDSIDSTDCDEEVVIAPRKKSVEIIFPAKDQEHYGDTSQNQNMTLEHIINSAQHDKPVNSVEDNDYDNAANSTDFDEEVIITPRKSPEEIIFPAKDHEHLLDQSQNQNITPEHIINSAQHYIPINSVENKENETFATNCEDAPDQTPSKNASTAASLLYPVKLIFDYLISPFKSFKDHQKSEAKCIQESIIPTPVIQQDPLPVSPVEIGCSSFNLANDLLTSELSINDVIAGEVINDSQDNEQDFKLVKKRKYTVKKEPKLLSGHDSLWHSNKPRVSVKYNPDERSKLKMYIDKIESQKRARLM